LALAALLLTSPSSVHAQNRAEAARLPPLNISVFVSSRDDQCFDPGDVAAITKLATQEQARFNAQGSRSSTISATPQKQPKTCAVHSLTQQPSR
jgi:hypothetical protein